MKQILALVFTALILRNGVAVAQDNAQDPVETLEILDATSVDLNDFLWLKRPVLVFANSPADPRVVEQLDLLNDRPDPLLERDVVIIVDTDPDASSPLREQLRPRGFMLVVMGKDGEIELRKPAPWDVREISRTIDKMPLRQQEIRAGH